MELVDAMRLTGNEAEQLAESSDQFVPHRRRDVQTLAEQRWDRPCNPQNARYRNRLRF